jgi:hypothetical protein
MSVKTIVVQDIVSDNTPSNAINFFIFWIKI